MNPNITNAILMKIQQRGTHIPTLQLQKNFRNVYVNVAYTYSKARTLNDGGSIAASTWRDRPVVAINAEELGFALLPAASGNRICFLPERICKYFATSIGLI
jgi:hypothetical protein